MEKTNPVEQLQRIEQKISKLSIQFHNGSAAERSELLSRIEALRTQRERARLIVENINNNQNQPSTDNDIITDTNTNVTPFGDVCSNPKRPAVPGISVRTVPGRNRKILHRGRRDR